MKVLTLFKRCASCRSVFPLLDFPTRSKVTHKPNAYCLGCQRQYSRAYFHERDHAKQVRRVKRNTLRYQTRNSIGILRYLEDHPCVDCGERDPIVLDFDHVRGKKRRNVSYL